MTTIPERRGQVDVIAGFLVVAFALAAWRGWEGAPFLAGLAAIGAVGVAVAWISWRRKSTPFLAISPEEIFYGRLDQPGTVIPRGASGRLQFVRGFKQSGWFLKLDVEPDSPALSMIGFDMAEVRRVCEQHGWTFGDEPAA